MMVRRRLPTIVTRAFRLEAFRKLYPKDQATALYEQASAAVRAQGIKKKDVEIVAHETDNGILCVRAQTKGFCIPIWQGHWPPGDRTLTPAITELFAVPMLEQDLPRGVHESGEDYARRVHSTLKAQETGDKE